MNICTYQYPYLDASFLSICSFSNINSLYRLLHEQIFLYCLIPVTSHIEDMLIIAASKKPKIIPNSFWISNIEKKDGCLIKNIDRPIAIGESISAQIETPSRVLLISNICSIKLSINVKMLFLVTFDLVSS
jgi:hypothetical protein